MNGWLTPEGEFVECEQFKHDEVAGNRFGMCEERMYLNGYVKTFGSEASHTRFLTDKQIEFLEEHHIE